MAKQLFITITKLKYRLAFIYGKRKKIMIDLCGKRCSYSYKELILNSSPNVLWDYLYNVN